MLKKVFFYSRVWITLLAPFILILLPANFFDSGESICLSKRLANIECYACGLTKGVMHFIHFDFVKAWEFNKLTFIVVPFLFPLWLKSIYEIKGKRLPGILGKLT